MTLWPARLGTEQAVGRAIAAKVAEGVVRRDELFVTTKLAKIRKSSITTPVG